MPHYFFDTADHHRDIDDTGVELADDNAARREAIRYAGEVMRDQPEMLWDGTPFVVEVRDAARRLILCVTLTAADQQD